MKLCFFFAGRFNNPPTGSLDAILPAVSHTLYGQIRKCYLTLSKNLTEDFLGDDLLVLAAQPLPAKPFELTLLQMTIKTAFELPPSSLMVAPTPAIAPGKESAAILKIV